MAQYYSSIHDCPLNVFKQIQKDGDLKPLLISGEFDEQEANNAWLSIYDEYNTAVKSNRNNTTFERQKRMQILVNQYAMIKACLFLIVQKLQFNLLNQATGLDKNYEPHTYEKEVKVLNDFGFKVDINNIENELIRVEKQKENFKTKINIVKKELENDNKGSENWTINNTIFQCQKYQGYVFGPEAKVIDLVVCLNELILNNAQQKKNNGKSN